MKKHIITIAGLPGSGKSSTANAVAHELGYEHFSSGDLFREMAEERSMSVEEINFTAEKQKEIDLKVDEVLRQIGREKDYLVIDSRTAFHWIPDSFKVFLDLDLHSAAERTFAHIQKEGRISQTASSLEEVFNNTVKRMASEQKRYQNLYDLDVIDKNNFDLVISTKANDLEHVVKMIIAAYKTWITT